jgi:hypothetical protein
MGAYSSRGADILNSYVYKVNEQNVVGYHYGNWLDFFNKPQPCSWGLEDVVCKDHRPQVGDRILCYQTNLNEILGTAEVVEYKMGKLILQKTEGPFPRGIKVAILKKIDKRIRNLEAFQQGLIKTLYPISNRDADYLLGTIKRFWMDAEE